jgi:hypothetical protein
MSERSGGVPLEPGVRRIHDTTDNPEPYDYESGFAVKSVIQAQINQTRTGTIDPIAGNVALPWIAWGPYARANAATPRSDGLVWRSSDFSPDGTHLAKSGITKAADKLMSFFLASPFTTCWFLASGC